MGVAIDSLADMRLLLAGLPLDTVDQFDDHQRDCARSCSVLLPTGGRGTGVPGEKGGGTIQNDILKRGQVARGHLHLPAVSVDASPVVDTFSYCKEYLSELEHDLHLGLPHQGGRLDRRAGGVAFTLADGIAYVEAAIAAGLAVDEFALEALLLLQRPQQPLRRGCQVPGGPTHVGAHHDRAVRRHPGALQGAAVPHQVTGGSSNT